MKIHLVATGISLLLLSQVGVAQGAETIKALPAKTGAAVVTPVPVLATQTVPQTTGAIEITDAEAEAAPTEKSVATRLREEREQLEIQTEEEITQELEKSRIQDEKARREQFFAKDVFSSQAPIAPAVVEVEEEVVAPVAIQGQTQAEYDMPAAESEGYNYYLGLYGGMLNYPSVSNIGAANGATGLALGLSVTDQIWVEAGMTYSFQQSETQNFSGVSTDDIDHIGFSTVASYKFNFSAMPWLIPSAGVALAYTNRQYNGGDNSSSSFDGGVAIGADVPVGTGVTLGLDYRYMTNISYQRELPGVSVGSSLQGFATTQAQDLESFAYQLIMLNAKILF